MPKVLIAVVTCHQYRVRAQAQRDTWAAKVEGADLRFFLGRGEKKFDDEVILDVGDGYVDLPAKVKAMFAWSGEHAYDYTEKLDDDAYLQVERFLASGFEKHDYSGRLRGPSGMFPAPYCSGFAYCLNAKAAKVIADAPLNGDEAEDRFVGNALLKAGIAAHRDPRLVVISSQRNSLSGREGPRQGNDVIAACEFTPAVMQQVHEDWLKVPSGIRSKPLYGGKLSRVSILIKTFLRDGYLFRCVQGIRRSMPEARIIIVDDGIEGARTASKITFYEGLRNDGHICLWLPYDSGFGAKGNAAIPYFADRDYVLIGSDDFDFSLPDVRDGVEKLVTVLDTDPSIHIASGRVNGRAYESCLEIADNAVREIPVHRERRQVNGLTYFTCDLTVNYSVIRSSCFGPDKLHWDGGEVKIGGGEHGAFYFDAKKLGYGVAVVPEVSIREMPQDYNLMHPSYPQLRGRARAAGRVCLKKRGIDRWGLQDGTWETC